MDVKVIKPVDSTEKSASISKFTSDRQGHESGRRQRFPDSYKSKPEQKGINDFDRFFGSSAKKSTGTQSDFERLFRKAWEDNVQMQESAAALEQATTENAAPLISEWIWGISGNYRPIIKK